MLTFEAVGQYLDIVQRPSLDQKSSGTIVNNCANLLQNPTDVFSPHNRFREFCFRDLISFHLFFEKCIFEGKKQFVDICLKIVISLVS